jgi:hypothetical protein
MANSTATLAINLSFTQPGGGSATITPISVLAPYQAMVAGRQDIPDSTAAETVYALPVGTGLQVESASAIILKNTGNQDLGVRFQDAAADEFQLPAGGVVILGAAALPGANPITKLELVTTEEQSGEGSFEYLIFGDPADLA